MLLRAKRVFREWNILENHKRYRNGHILKHGRFQLLTIIISLVIIDSNLKVIEHSIQSPTSLTYFSIFPPASYKFQHITELQIYSVPLWLFCIHRMSDFTFILQVLLLLQYLILISLPLWSPLQFSLCVPKEVSYRFKLALIEAHASIIYLCTYLSHRIESFDGGSRGLPLFVAGG